MGVCPNRDELGLVAQAASCDEALWHTFNTTDRAEGIELHVTFVHDSGRALFEMGLPWLDGAKAATIDPRLVRVPLLFVAAEKDRLTPPDVVRRTRQRFDHIAELKEYSDQGHWVVGQPGWKQIADDATSWLDSKVM